MLLRQSCRPVLACRCPAAPMRRLCPIQARALQPSSSTLLCTTYRAISEPGCRSLPSDGGIRAQGEPVPSRVVQPTAAIVAARVPPVHGIALRDLARVLPDDVLESVAAEEKGLLAFLRRRPAVFHVEPLSDARGGPPTYWVRVRPQADRRSMQCAGQPAARVKACRPHPASAARAGNVVGSSGSALALAPRTRLLAGLLRHVQPERALPLQMLWSLYLGALDRTEVVTVNDRVERTGAVGTSETCARGDGTRSQWFADELTDLAVDAEASDKVPPETLGVQLYAIVEALSHEASGDEVLHGFHVSPLSFRGVDDATSTYSATLASYVTCPADFTNMTYASVVALPFMAASAALPGALPTPCFYRLSLYVVPFFACCAPNDGVAVGGDMVDGLLDPIDVGGGCLEMYDVMRLARAMKVDEPVPLSTLSSAARLLTTQPLGLVLSLYTITEQRHWDRQQVVPSPELGVFQLTRSVAEGPGWVVAVSFRLDKAQHVPELARTFSRAELQDRLVAVTQEYQGLRKQLSKQRVARERCLAEEASVVSEPAVDPSGMRPSERSRLALYKERRELQRCLAILDRGLTPLLHPEVLAYAIYDAMPQLPTSRPEVGPVADEGTAASTVGSEQAETAVVPWWGQVPMVPLGQLRYLLPGNDAPIVLTSLRWAKSHESLFHCVFRNGQWFVIRRDVHEQLLARQQEEQQQQQSRLLVVANGNSTELGATACAQGGGDSVTPAGRVGGPDREGTAVAAAAGLYDSVGSLADEREIVHLVVALLASSLMERRGCVQTPRAMFSDDQVACDESPASRSTTVRAVMVPSLWSLIPKPVRQRIIAAARERKQHEFSVDGDDGASTEMPSRREAQRQLGNLDYFTAWLRRFPRVFQLCNPASPGRGGADHHHHRQLPPLVRLAAAYDPLA